MSKSRPNYKHTTLDFTVSQDDIDKGLRNHPYFSPAGLALARLGYTVDVSKIFVTFYGCERDRKLEHPAGIAPTPQRLKYLISKFNNGGAVTPSNFRLKIGAYIRSKS